MSTASKKRPPVRQLSLHSEKQFYKSQKPFKKQSSLDLAIENSKQNRVQSAKGRIGDFTRSSVKLAWTEDVASSESKPSTLIVSNRDSENARNFFRNTKHSSIETLHPHQELQKRLEETWKRSRNKPNINIYLTPNNPNEDESPCAGNKITNPKIISPLYPEQLDESVFQKKLKRHNINATNQSTERNKCKAVVVVPLIESQHDASKHSATSENLNENTDTLFEKCKTFKDIDNSKAVSSTSESNEKSSINVVLKPSTSLRRESFQKKNDQTKDNFRPPLIRASSVPSKLDKPKFIAHRRRIKSAKHKNNKNFYDATSDEETTDFSQERFQKRLHKFIQFSGSEIITMVSLVSPDNTDIEDNFENKQNESKIINENLSEDFQKSHSLRKTVKTVSFQQCSIHAVRSFSASFPARRKYNFDKMQETSGTATESCFLKDKNISLLSAKTRFDNDLANTSSVPSKESEDNEEKLPNNPDNDKEQSSQETSIAKENSSPKFDSDKEKQCWELYTKVNQKGVSVTFDTILRGMLTPTEYRLRRRHSLAEVETPNSENYR